MVTKRVMSISRFVPGAQSSEQQQPPLAQAQTPPPPHPSSPSRTRKRPQIVEQTQLGSGDASTRTPLRQYRGITIQEPTPLAALNVASSSQTSPSWQPSFMLDGKPLPSTTYCTKFGARPTFAQGCSYLRGWNGRVVGQAATVAYYCDNSELSIPSSVLY